MRRLIYLIEKAGDIKLILFLFLLQFVVHVKYSNYPPVGFHLWRQTMGLSVARNFYEEEMNILKPRLDSRGELTGITGMEFPVVNYLIAVSYKIFGLNDITPRYIILLFSLVAIAYSYLFFKLLFGGKLYGFVAAFFLIFSPLFCYYSFVVMPEVPSLSFLFVSLYHLKLWEGSSRAYHLILSLFFLSFSALIKVNSLISLPFFFFLLYKKRGLDFKNLFFVFLSVALVAGWYFYARYLSYTYKNFDFRLSPNLPHDIDEILNSTKRVFIQWLPELYINYAQFIFFLLGIYSGLKFKSRYGDVLNFVFLYGVGLIFYMIMFYPALYWHDYYMVASLPFLISICVVGFKFFISDILEGEATFFKKLLRYVLSFALILVPVLGSIRGLSRFEVGLKSMPGELLTLESHLDEVIPDRKSLVIVCCDESPSVYLYFAHRKGWSITDKVSELKLIEMIDKGAKYLICDDRGFEGREDIKRHLEKISEYGRFNVFRLKR